MNKISFYSQKYAEYTWKQGIYTGMLCKITTVVGDIRRLESWVNQNTGYVAGVLVKKRGT